MAMHPRPKTDLAASTVWAVVVVILGFFGLIAFLISGGHSADLQRMLVLVGQGFLALVQIFIVYRSSLSTNKRVEQAVEKVEDVKAIAKDVQQTVNGNTPQPGEIPKISGDV
jgi:hypothetical protein